MSQSVLLVDDDQQILDMLSRFFEKRGWQVGRASTGAAALALHGETRPDLVVLDLRLPDLPGLPVLSQLRERDADVSVIMLTGHGDIETAVDAMRAGAENFLTKPVDLAHLEAVAERAAEVARIRRRNRMLTEGEPGAPELEALGTSPCMREVAGKIERVVAGDGAVLLLGETGTGKGWVARLIHNLSDRQDAPLVDINCGGLTPTFLDSELFGHEKGAFTDAKERKRGLFEVADRGTVFLDEIGDLAPELQPKLLKVLEEKRFRRVGGTAEIQVDVRLVAATNHDLEAAVRQGRFRDDLYYRLAVLPIRLPPLRERSREDVALLAHRLLAELRRGKGPRRIGARAMDLLLRHPWPGNIRELRNVLERMVILAGDVEELSVAHVPTSLEGPGARDGNGRETASAGEPISLEELEQRHIRVLLERNEGNRSRTARELGISRATLYDKIDRYGFEDVGRD